MWRGSHRGKGSEGGRRWRRGQESVRFHGPPSAGSSLVDEAQFEPSGQSAVVSVAVVAVVVGVAIMDGIVCIFRVGD